MDSCDDLFDAFEASPPSSSIVSNVAVTVSLNGVAKRSRNKPSIIEERQTEESNIDVPVREAKLRRKDSNLQDEPVSNSLSHTMTELQSPSSRSLDTEIGSTSSSSHPAKIYPFKLDLFQRTAISYIERNESCLVAAHTSAGKTAVAEYAIAQSLKRKQRVIYTSPIKALSNQKFRDMQEEFQDVGLMTGDMTINPNATCLIMTTEILRSMLYRGSEVVREVAWVIYDEVHYMRDKERGVVWEESIILLPHKVRFVFLSATIPNAKEFVDWISKLHHQPCHVVYTDYRPVPLQHYVFPNGAEGLHLVVDEKGHFRQDNFDRAMSSLIANAADQADAGKSKKGSKSGPKNSTSDLFRIVRLVMERELDPCIVFSFSKKDCETYALQMARLDFTNADEKGLIEHVFVNALEALSEDDKRLPQIETILPLLKRGIGIHHGGLLPILKEVIEILFQESLIKCLFATETFSIGINMPARTVVFTNTRKFDGQDFRWITSGEYIQMSGRAGRRGKDDKGIVIQMLDEKMEPEVAKSMLYGPSDPLFSSYQVTYNMVLNMLRVEDADPENLLKLSFHQFQHERKSPEFADKADELQREASEILIRDEGTVATYFSLIKQFNHCQCDTARIIQRVEYCLPFLQPGRLIQLQVGEIGWGWGVIINIRSCAKSSGLAKDTFLIGSTNSAYVLDVLLPVVKQNGNIFMPGDSVLDGGNEEVHIVQASLDSLFQISIVRLNLPKDLKPPSALLGVHNSLRELKRRFEDSDGIPVLDPVKDIGISDDSLLTLVTRAEELKNRIAKSPFHSDPEKNIRIAEYGRKLRLLEESGLYRSKARESQFVMMRDELRRMKRVLRRLGFISSECVLETKGRFSCELNTADELLLTELVFEGIFNELDLDEIVGLLSCFVHQEPVKESGYSVLPKMQSCFKKFEAVARNIAKAKIDAKLTCDEEEYVKSFSPSLMEVTMAWSSGAKFVDCCRLTDVFEGSIIRSIRRLEELLRQLASASSSIGNSELQGKFEGCANKIRRGIVFAASLYL